MDTLSSTLAYVKRVAEWQTTQAGPYTSLRRPERVPEVGELRLELRGFGIKELKYFDEGLDCIQYAQAPRAAIVLGWTGFVDLLQARIARDGFVGLNGILKTEFHGVYKRVGQVHDRVEFSHYFDDALLLTAARKLCIVQKHTHTQLDAMRDERNNCAHVEEYAVNVRIALGYYARLIQYLPFVL